MASAPRATAAGAGAQISPQARNAAIDGGTLEANLAISGNLQERRVHLGKSLWRRPQLMLGRNCRGPLAFPSGSQLCAAAVTWQQQKTTRLAAAGPNTASAFRVTAAAAGAQISPQARNATIDGGT